MSSRKPSQRKIAAAAHYLIEPANPADHEFVVELTVAQPAKRQRVSLPVWIPGSYLVREFARHLHGLQARQGRSACRVQQIDKCTWDIACDPERPLVLRYKVYAFDNSVRTAWLDSQRGFFNPTSLCLRVHGHEEAPHTLKIAKPSGAPDWKLATALTPSRTTSDGFGSYTAANYDELADSPVEMGVFWSGSFIAGGVEHRFVVAGAPASFDGARLLQDTQKICEAAIRFWHGAKTPPHQHYLFMLSAVDDGYGGLEHRFSTALICTRRDLPRQEQARASEGYTTLLGLISHEYFHTWNVKRLRPSEFARYDYTQENYTQLLWFFEGFTSYYDDLILRRAGLIDDAGYFKLLTKTINQVQQAPGRHVQSVAEASFDAWTKYYRPDENTPNSTISYYTKGALVALCFDLTLRSEGRTTLDDVMRALWQRCQGGPMAESDFVAVLSELGGRSFEREVGHWVHGTSELPLKQLLQAQGVRLLDEPSQLAQVLGLRVSETDGNIVVKVVLAGGAAASAGLAAGDEWIGVELSATRGVPATSWRMNKLEDLPLYAGAARQVTALVARDKRLLRLSLALPTGVTTWRLLPPDGVAGDPLPASARPWPGR
ncbi:M61 family metallopeptidase [Ottowia thiooxydans]|uniref:M61 family metallopeptidase n=1 Tax=Ottowia thiooxydans TaxID=219182 RepID=UPI00042460AE|nr:M61 family metallopeptidase [Ottowia thiooxydans]